MQTAIEKCVEQFHELPLHEAIEDFTVKVEDWMLSRRPAPRALMEAGMPGFLRQGLPAAWADIMGKYAPVLAEVLIEKLTRAGFNGTAVKLGYWLRNVIFEQVADDLWDSQLATELRVLIVELKAKDADKPPDTGGTLTFHGKPVPYRSNSKPVQILRLLANRDRIPMQELVPAVWPSEEYTPEAADRKYRKRIEDAKNMLIDAGTPYSLTRSGGFVTVLKIEPVR